MTYKPAREAWDHQKRALAKSKGKKVFAFLLGMRLGKTKITIDDFGRVWDKGEVDALFVLAPGGVYRTWEEAIKEDFDRNHVQKLNIYIWESSYEDHRGKDRDRFMTSMDRGRVPVLLMNVEALSAVREARVFAKKFMSKHRTYLAIDESTVIKEPDSTRTKFIVNELGGVGGLATYRRILSGLPTPKSPLDIFSQFEFLDWRILQHRTFAAFSSEYANTRKRPVRIPGATGKVKFRFFNEIIGYKNVGRINKLIEPYSFREVLENVYDVPAKTYSFRDVEMTKEQERLYKEIKKYATAQIEGDKYVTATVIVAQIIRLHQILLGHTVDEEGGFHELKENRTKELLSILDEYDGKAIIWCSYDYNVQKVYEALEKRFGEGSTARFWGGNRDTREAEEKRFKTEVSCRFMVATAAAGGRGRTWSVANLVVYYSSGYDLEHRSQSEERPQGVGKMDKVAYIDLRCPGTVEQPMIESLRNKIDLASVITGDNYKEWLI